EGAQVVRGGEQLLQGGDTARPVPLEEGGLRLHRGDVATDRLDGAEREATQTLDVVLQAPPVEQRGVRVDPHAQRAVGIHGSGQACPERSASPAHASVLAACSCRLATANGPRRSASMPCTAAWSCWTVVTIGRSTAVVAARIS